MTDKPTDAQLLVKRYEWLQTYANILTCECKRLVGDIRGMVTSDGRIVMVRERLEAALDKAQEHER